MNGQRTTRGKSIVRNGIYGFSTFFVPLVLSFFATPIIVRHLGNEDYGIYALILGFISYSFNFNVGRAITKYVAEYRTGGRTDEISEVVAATLLINIVLGLIGLILIFSSADFLVSVGLKIQPEAYDKTVYALYIAALTIFFLMLNQVYNAIIQGLVRFDIYAKIFNLRNILLISGNLLLAMMGVGLISLLLWNLFITALIALISIIAAKKLLPEMKLKFSFSREKLKLVFNYSSGVIAYQILANVLLLFERSWITGKLGAETLTLYVVPMMLALYIHGFISSLTMMIFPLASEMSSDKENLLRLYQKSTKIVSFLAVFMGATLIVESKNFLTLWMGADFADKSWHLLILHTITFSLLAITVVSWQLTEGLGRPQLNTYFFMLCFIISISGMIFLLPDFGSFGVGLARTFGFSSLFIWVFYVEKRFLGNIQFGFWLKLLGMLALATTLSILVELFLGNFLELSWLKLFITTFFGGVVYCLTAWIIGFVTDEEIDIFKRIYNR